MDRNAKNVLVYHISEADLRTEASHIHGTQIGGDAVIAAYFFDVIEQHDLIVGVDFEVEVQQGIRARTGNGQKWLEQTYITELTFKDEAKALQFKLSHDGGAA